MRSKTVEIMITSSTTILCYSKYEKIISNIINKINKIAKWINQIKDHLNMHIKFFLTGPVIIYFQMQVAVDMNSTICRLSHYLKYPTQPQHKTDSASSSTISLMQDWMKTIIIVTPRK